MIIALYLIFQLNHKLYYDISEKTKFNNKFLSVE